MDASGTALVTGASRGLGRAVAVELAVRGFDVVATMRRPADGDDLAEAVAAAADGAAAAAPAGSIRTAELDVTRADRFPMPDGLRVVVNNAGIEGSYLPIEHAAMDEWRAQFETNVFGLLAVTRAAIPALRASGGGVLCNVTSSSILVPMPLYGAYRASKAAASALGESLLSEVRQFGIRVLEIMPGPVDTDMLRLSDRLPEAAGLDGYDGLAAYAQAGRQGVADLITPAPVAAARVVDAILDDDAPLRVGCDDLSVGLLEAWRLQPDEQWLRSLLP